MTHAEGVRARQTHEHASGMIFQVSYRRDYIERTHCHWGKEPYFQLCFSFSLPFVAWISFVFRTWFGVSWMIKKQRFFPLYLDSTSFWMESIVSHFFLHSIDLHVFWQLFAWNQTLTTKFDENSNESQWILCIVKYFIEFHHKK